jgi:hypothetical protein
MSLFQRISGIIGTKLQLDVVNAGPQLKNESNTVAARNAADAAYAIVRCADPVAANDAVNLESFQGGGQYSHYRITSGGTDAPSAADALIGVDTSGSAVAVTLPASNSVGASTTKAFSLTFHDIANNAGAHNVTFLLTGGDTLTGIFTTINVNSGTLTVYTDGDGKWYSL